jgi:hypothetical protein
MSYRSHLLLSTFALFSSLAAAAEPITPAQFDEVRKVIKPQAGEDKWAEIPWLTNLWQARQVAAKAGKPILLWEMDGNPLGCV